MFGALSSTVSWTRLRLCRKRRVPPSPGLKSVITLTSPPSYRLEALHCTNYLASSPGFSPASCLTFWSHDVWLKSWGTLGTRLPCTCAALFPVSSQLLSCIIREWGWRGSFLSNHTSFFTHCTHNRSMNHTTMSSSRRTPE